MDAANNAGKVQEAGATHAAATQALAMNPSEVLTGIEPIRTYRPMYIYIYIDTHADTCSVM